MVLDMMRKQFRSIYTEMMYYANDLLNELEGVVPQYTQNLSVSFSGQYDLNYKQYPMPIAYVGRIEGEKKVNSYLRLFI